MKLCVRKLFKGDVVSIGVGVDNLFGLTVNSTRMLVM